MTAEQAPPINPLRQGLEARLGRHTARRALFVGPLLVGLFWIARGADGAIGAAIGVAIVVGYFVLYGLMLSVAARLSLSAYHAAALFGFFVRIGLVAAVLLVLGSIFELDRIAVGIAVVASYLVLLTWEAAAVAGGRERNNQWTG